MPHPILQRFPQLRRITNSDPVRRAIRTSRTHNLVDDRLKYICGEVIGGTRCHRLTVAPFCTVVVRHKTRDMAIFDEVFRSPFGYEPPPAAASALRDIEATRPLRILDLGGNVGLFGVFALSRYPTAEIMSYEPEPDNLRVLKACVARNPGANWTVVQACAITADGVVQITPGGFADSHVSDSGVDVPGVDVLPLLGDHDFVKMDIEGSEWPILLDPRWPDAVRDVAAFTIEWHERQGPTDPRSAALAAIEGAGFTCVASPPGWDHGNIWGWR
jgi:FkbM family methyltransferase